MGCLCCGADVEVGALCRSCARSAAPCEGLIPEHIHSRTDSTDADAWVIDCFGRAHAIEATTSIGRDHDRDLIVLASSVSRDHARLQRIGSSWTVHDPGSRNGTFVGGVRVLGTAELPVRALLKVGDVALWFLAEVVAEPPRRPTVATGATGGTTGRPVHVQLVHGEVELAISVGEDHTAGGALLWRPAGIQRWAERSLAPLEFQLLRALCMRALDEITAPSMVRGCVPSKQLVDDLPFQSKYANADNVRQIVLRLRGVLTEVGAKGVLALAPGRGYYLACGVAVVSNAARFDAERQESA